MTDILERLYKSPLSFAKHPIWTILSDLAAEENCDGEPYDQMMIAVEWMHDAITEIHQLRASEARLRGIIDGTLSSRDWAYAKSKGYDALAETESDDD